MNATGQRRYLLVRAGSGLLLGALALVCSSTPMAGAGGSSGERAGDTVIVAGDGAMQPVTEGGSLDMFSMRLPGGAACEGDSAHAGYRVQTFLVPDGTDPGGLEYEELRPIGVNTWSLMEESTDPFVNALTSQSAPGEPGLITELPRFRFDPLFPGELPAGVYRIGVACTLDNVTTRYWDTDFTVTEDPNDEPSQLRWSTSGDLSGGTSSGSPVIDAPLIAGGLGVAALVVLVVARRRNRSAAPPSKEEV